MKKVTIMLICCLVSLVSCYYDNEAYLYGEEICTPGESTYALTVAPVISRNCLSCHSQAAANGGIVLETYADVKQQAQNGKLLGSITHAGGFSPMPKNAAQLSQCNINAIRSWIDAGATDN